MNKLKRKPVLRLELDCPVIDKYYRKITHLYVV